MNFSALEPAAFCRGKTEVQLSPQHVLQWVTVDVTPRSGQLQDLLLLWAAQSHWTCRDEHEALGNMPCRGCQTLSVPPEVQCGDFQGCSSTQEGAALEKSTMSKQHSSQICSFSIHVDAARGHMSQHPFCWQKQDA